MRLSRHRIRQRIVGPRATPGWLARQRERRRITRAFRERMGRAPVWRRPRDFSDKLQWLKLHHRDPRMVQLGDKLAAREWVRDRVGEDVLTPLLGVWKHADAIDFDALPGRFVLKTNAASGWNVICRDRAAFDPEAARARLRDWMGRDYGAEKGEWHYARMPRRILGEPCLEDADGRLWEFKVFCFGGRARLALVVVDRFDDIASVYLDRGARPLAMSRPRKRPRRRLDVAEVPLRAWERTLEVAERIAAPFPYVRVDLFVLDGADVRFGEATFFPLSGMTPVEPLAMERRLGDWLVLPR